MNNFQVWIDNIKVSEISGVEAAYEAYNMALEMAKEGKKSCYLIDKDTAQIVMKYEPEN